MKWNETTLYSATMIFHFFFCFECCSLTNNGNCYTRTLHACSLLGLLTYFSDWLSCRSLVVCHRWTGWNQNIFFLVLFLKNYRKKLLEYRKFISNTSLNKSDNKPYYLSMKSNPISRTTRCFLYIHTYIICYYNPLVRITIQCFRCFLLYLKKCILRHL